VHTSSVVAAHLNGLVSSAWRSIYAFGPSHWSLSEALVATLGFWAAGAFFECLHFVFPAVLRSRLHENNDDGSAEGGDDDADGVDSNCKTGALKESSKKKSSQKPKVITSLRFFMCTKVGGSAVYLSAIALFHAFLRTKPPLPLEPPSFVRFAAEVR
jgi:hypothetical protein